MKTIVRIAKLELSTLFYSPIAWFILVIFLYQCGMEYTSLLENAVISQELKSALNNATFLTAKIFSGRYAFYGQIISKLYLYLPLLTMGLMSREISSGTIKLLYSSPIKIRAIVFGKFLSMMIYSLILVAVIGFFVIAACFNIQNADISLLLSGLLGIYLLLCAYSAIGLFMSSLTSYQVVAALCTLVTFALLSYIGTVWQNIDFVRDLTYFLSISGRTENMLGGLITSKDVLYFVLVIFIFLGLSIYKLKGGRESKSGIRQALRYVAIITLALLIGYLSSRPGVIAYYDATANKSRTLSPSVQKIIKEMDDAPLEVTTYVNLIDGRFYYGNPKQRNIDMERWATYLRFKPDIKFKYIYYYDSIPSDFGRANPGLNLRQIAEKNAKSYKVDIKDFKTPDEIRKIIDLKPELNRYVMQLKYKGKTTYLRLYNDMLTFPSETETAAALKRLTVKLPKISFVQGELERSIEKMGDRDYRNLSNEITFRSSLVNQGFDVDSVFLNKQDIPSDIAALVIADPKNDFSPAAISKINAYIQKGGNLLIAGEPDKQGGLNPIIEPLGVKMTNGILVQQSKDYAPDLILPNLTAAAAAFSKALMQNFNDSIVVSMPGAVGLICNENAGFKVQPLLVTNAQKSWNKIGKLVVDSADVVFNPANGDEKKSVPTAVSLSRNINGQEQRIAILGDADVLSNAELSRFNLRNANFAFGIGLMSWFSNGQFPIDTTRPKSTDNVINVTGDGVGRMKIIFLGVLPGLVLIAGAVLLIRRKRK